MAIDGFSTFVKIPKERRKGHRPFLVFSLVLLAATSIHLVFDIWAVFNSIFNGGPDGKSYIDAYRKSTQTYDLNRRVTIAGGSMGDLTVVVGDMLLVSLNPSVYQSVCSRSDVFRKLWRCAMMWSNKRWVLLVPALAYVGSVGT
jgi:hypothetical protein